jgi:hypothetical protein
LKRIANNTNQNHQQTNELSTTRFGKLVPLLNNPPTKAINQTEAQEMTIRLNSMKYSFNSGSYQCSILLDLTNISSE